MVSSASQADPAHQVKFRERLELETGTIVKMAAQSLVAVNAVRDEAGFAELKELAKNIQW